MPSDALTKLTGLRVEGHAEVGEEGEGDLADDRDAVLEVGGEVGVAADGGETIDGQRNLHVGPSVGLLGSRGTSDAVGVGEVELDRVGDEGVGRGGADVEAADVVLAAAVDAGEGRSDLAAEAGDVS